jgi:hypothetical protein
VLNCNRNLLVIRKVYMLLFGKCSTQPMKLLTAPLTKRGRRQTVGKPTQFIIRPCLQGKKRWPSHYSISLLCALTAPQFAATLHKGWAERVTAIQLGYRSSRLSIDALFYRPQIRIRYVMIQYTVPHIFLFYNYFFNICRQQILCIGGFLTIVTSINFLYGLKTYKTVNGPCGCVH